MWQIASQMFLCLLLAGIIGAVAGWAVAALLGRGTQARLDEATARVVSLERELALATRRATDAEAARIRLAADLEGTLVRTQELELRRRSAEERATTAEAGLRTVRERGEATEVALAAALARATEAEGTAREAASLREQADVRWRAETVRAAHAEEAIRTLEMRTAEELEPLRADRERLQASLREALEPRNAEELEQLRADRERLQASLREAMESRNAEELEQLRADRERLQASLREAMEPRNAEELEQLRADRERLQASLREAMERLNGVQAQFTSSRERLEASLDTEAGERATIEQRLRQTLERQTLLEASHRALETGRDGAEARVRSLENALRDGDGEREEVGARLQSLESRLRAEQEAHQRAQTRVLELTRLLEARTAQRPERHTRPPPPREGIVRRRASRRSRRDDLKEIVGVGPVLERLLHRRGVHTFRQVALWTPEDIRRIDKFLHEFHGRIRRDHWVRQARSLHRRRHGEALAPQAPRPTNGDPLQPSP